MDDVTRRRFLATLSALAGTAATGLGQKSASGQQVFPSDKEIREHLRNIRKHPIEVPQDMIDSALDANDAFSSELDAYRDLVEILVAPTDAAPLLSILDSARNATSASRDSLLDFVNQVETKGFPSQSAPFYTKAGQALQLLSKPFQENLTNWVETSADAQAEIPDSVLSDPKFAPLFAKVCESSPYAPGFECPPAGETLVEINNEAAAGLGLLIAAAALVFAVGILLILLLSDEDAVPCDIGAAAVEETVDNNEFTQRLGNDIDALRPVYRDVLIKSYEDSPAVLSKAIKNQITAWIAAEEVKEKNENRRRRLIALQGAAADAAC